jgi:hypothetical protein
MSYTSFDAPQQHWQNPQYNPQQWAQFHPQAQQAFGQPIGTGMASGLGQAAFGTPYGTYGGAQPYGQTGIGGWGAGGFGAQGIQRQLSPQDVSDVVRQLVPLLPQVIAQAQQPQAAFAHNPYGQGAYGQTRTLTPQDVNDVVRAILPALPQIVGMLQGQAQFPSGPAHWFGSQGGLGQAAFGHSLATQYPQGIGQPLPFSAAFAAGQPFGQTQQRQLTPQDLGEVARQLAGVIPQVIGNLQARQAWMN